ncbi:hypothetical protein ACFVH6_40415 [Spirillospora sp. NPDC127200]
MTRLMTGIADRLVSAVIPKATASAACTPGYFTRCSNRICRTSGIGYNWRERWYLTSNCIDHLSDATYRCNC